MNSNTYSNVTLQVGFADQKTRSFWIWVKNCLAGKVPHLFLYEKEQRSTNGPRSRTITGIDKVSRAGV